MSGKCVIISGGEFAENICTDNAFVITCDKGYEYALRLGIEPDLFIGDFDSFHGKISERTEILSLPIVKDDTDTLFAARYALDKGFDDISIYCALGGRLDHSFANIQTGAFIASKGSLAAVYGHDQELYFLSGGSINLKQKDGYALSVFSISDKCTGVNISGAKYPLNDFTLINTFPLGVSNEWASDMISVSASTGILMVSVCRIS